MKELGQSAVVLCVATGILALIWVLIQSLWYKLGADRLLNKDTYEMLDDCTNCRHIMKIRVPIGVPVESYRRDAKCEHCGVSLGD